MQKPIQLELQNLIEIDIGTETVIEIDIGIDTVIEPEAEKGKEREREGERVTEIWKKLQTCQTYINERIIEKSRKRQLWVERKGT